MNILSDMDELLCKVFQGDRVIEYEDFKNILGLDSGSMLIVLHILGDIGIISVSKDGVIVVKEEYKSLLENVG